MMRRQGFLLLLLLSLLLLLLLLLDQQHRSQAASDASDPRQTPARPWLGQAQCRHRTGPRKGDGARGLPFCRFAAAAADNVVVEGQWGHDSRQTDEVGGREQVPGFADERVHARVAHRPQDLRGQGPSSPLRVQVARRRDELREPEQRRPKVLARDPGALAGPAPKVQVRRGLRDQDGRHDVGGRGAVLDLKVRDERRDDARAGERA